MTDKVDGLVLAAGRASRFGSNKLMAVANNRTIIGHTIKPLLEVCQKIVVVTGFYGFEGIFRNDGKVEMVQNRHPEDGMFSSIREGLQHICSPRIFMVPGDYPLIKTETYLAMLECTDDIVIPTFLGKKGHPLLFNHCLTDEILNERYSSMDQFLAGHPFTMVEVNDAGILQDIDTINDLNSLRI